MTIWATCPGCGKRISAPDTAAGHKAKCPKCGHVVRLPAGAGPDADRPDPAEALARAAAESAQRGGGATEATRPAAEGAASSEPASGVRPSPSRSGLSQRRSSTTLSRLAARTSPYRPLRFLAAVVFGMAVTVAVLAFVGGLVGLILLAVSGSPGVAVIVFVAALVAAAGVLVGGKIVSELLRLWADVGDRTRQMVMILEERAARPEADEE